MPEETNYPPEIPVSNPLAPPAPPMTPPDLPVTPPAPPPVSPTPVPEPTPGDNLEAIMHEAPPQPKKSKGSFLKFLVFSLLVLLLASLAFGYYQYNEVQRLSRLVSTTTPTPALNLSPTPAADSTANWQVYKNKEYGYLIKYPKPGIYEDRLHGEFNNCVPISEISVNESDCVSYDVEGPGVGMTLRVKAISLTDRLVELKEALSINQSVLSQIENGLEWTNFTAEEDNGRSSRHYLIEKNGLLYELIFSPDWESVSDLMFSSFSFIEEEACQKARTEEEMSLSKAKEIALASSCTLEGDLTGDSSCNQVTGTWWLDIEADKEGCNPACVIDVVTGGAEINWRCTGLVQPEATITPTPCPTCGD